MSSGDHDKGYGRPHKEQELVFNVVLPTPVVEMLDPSVDVIFAGPGEEVLVGFEECIDKVHQGLTKIGMVPPC